MRNLSLFTLALFLISIGSLGAQLTPQPNQIVHLFRHGARGPLMGYDKTWHGYEFGALTASGTRQHYVLGKTLAKKYSNVFSKGYNPYNVYMLSDFTYRCVQSASAQLDGLFEGKGLSLRPNFAPEVAVPPFIDPLVQETVASLSEASALPANRVPTIVNVVDSTNAAIFQRNRGAACPNGGVWERQNTFSKETSAAWAIFNPLQTENINWSPKNLNFLDLGSGPKSGNQNFLFKTRQRKAF